MGKETKEEKMKISKQIEELKKKHFSDGLRKYFEENHKLMQENILIFKDLKSPDGSSVEDTSLLMMFSIMGEKIWTTLDTISDGVEGAHLMNIILRKRIENLENKIKQHGIKLDDISSDEGLEWINNYFKHVGKTSID